MKKLLLCMVAVSAMTFTSCKENAADKVKAENVEAASARDAQEVYYPTMDFESKTYDFGTINEGDVVEHTFTFTNNGKAPLVITNARPSCGCTVPSYTKEPVAPGESGEIVVKFNSKGKPNTQNKSVTIKNNTEKGTDRIQFKAMVTPSSNSKTVSSNSPVKVK